MHICMYGTYLPTYIHPVISPHVLMYVCMYVPRFTRPRTYVPTCNFPFSYPGGFGLIGARGVGLHGEVTRGVEEARWVLVMWNVGGGGVEWNGMEWG